MEDEAVLDLTLTERDESRYFLNFRFTTPDNISGTNLGTGQGLEIVFDLAKLRTSPDAKTYGHRLSEQFFAAEAARAAYRMARALVPANASFRVRLTIVPAHSEIHGLRWETLVDPQDGNPICTNANVLFSRYITADSTRKFIRPDLDDMRAVVVVANPSGLKENYDLAPVPVQDEIDRARAGLGDLAGVILDSQGKATLDGLVNAIRSGCNLVYLVAHGSFGRGSPVLFLENEDGGVFPCPAEMLISRLSELDRLPLLVMLVSCQSAGTGDGVAETALVALGPRLTAAGIPAVMAMQGSVTFQTMARFMPEFLNSLLVDGQIDHAAAVARASVHGANRPDWWMPVIFSNLNDNRLFTPPASWVIDPKFEPETVLVRAGKFLMGSAREWECPPGEVILPAYRIGKYPVTNRQYAEFVRDTGQAVNQEMLWEGRNPPLGRLDDPVSGVTWYQAMAYCEWLGRKTGRRYTLPSEAQWEKAARGEAGQVFPWGNDWQKGRANEQVDLITPVNRFEAQTPYGCFDMVGNAREWTLSLWGEKRSEPDPQYRYPWQDDGRNDPNANDQVRRVFRGGASENPAEMTCSARDSFVPSRSGPAGKRHGFRVAVNL